jgi:hypothetical protein
MRASHAATAVKTTLSQVVIQFQSKATEWQ